MGKSGSYTEGLHTIPAVFFFYSLFFPQTNLTTIHQGCHYLKLFINSWSKAVAFGKNTLSCIFWQYNFFHVYRFSLEISIHLINFFKLEIDWHCTECRWSIFIKCSTFLMIYVLPMHCKSFPICCWIFDMFEVVTDFDVEWFVAAAKRVKISYLDSELDTLSLSEVLRKVILN